METILGGIIFVIGLGSTLFFFGQMIYTFVKSMRDGIDVHRHVKEFNKKQKEAKEWRDTPRTIKDTIARESWSDTTKRET